MGFDNICKIVGIEKYFGRTEYKNEKDFDGKWGIFDGPFFKYFANEIDKMKEPFFTSIFSLSSHHPFTIPENFKKNNKLSHLTPFQQSIFYTDNSLKIFFDIVSKKEWFDRTLFVITADHTSAINDINYNNRVGMYRIPIILFKPNDNKFKGYSDEIIQQTDIMPTILNYTGSNNQYFLAFGNDMLNKNAEHWAVNFINDTYEIIYENYSLIFDGKETIGFYNWKQDKLLKNNLITDAKMHNKKILLEQKLKAIIETYNYRLIKNNLTLRNDYLFHK
jgi:phosphoglycerol transferase MdoB-like AlkP superfamily enzyme